DDPGKVLEHPVVPGACRDLDQPPVLKLEALAILGEFVKIENRVGSEPDTLGHVANTHGPHLFRYRWYPGRQTQAAGARPALAAPTPRGQRRRRRLPSRPGQCARPPRP